MMKPLTEEEKIRGLNPVKMRERAREACYHKWEENDTVLVLIPDGVPVERWKMTDVNKYKEKMGSIRYLPQETAQGDTQVTAGAIPQTTGEV